MLVLAISVGLPGLVLSYFAFRSVRSEAIAEQAHFQQRCETVASSLYSEVRGRFDVLQTDLGASIDQSRDRWAGNPAAAAEHLLQNVDGVIGVLSLDDKGKLVYPPNSSRRSMGESKLTRFQENLRAVMGRSFQLAETEEMVHGDYIRAAHYYQSAFPTIPGYRGQLIALNGRARCLYKGDRPEEALRLYRNLAREGAGYRDLNGFPLDLLAKYQLGLCQLTLQDPRSAALSFRSLMKLLADDPWTYGGIAESVISKKVSQQLEDPSMRALLPDDPNFDLQVVQATLEERQRRQQLEARVLDLIPDLAVSRHDEDTASGRFRYSRMQHGEQTFLFGRTTWRGPGGRRILLLHLDEEVLVRGLTQQMAGIREANPEMTIQLGVIGSGPSPLSAPAEGVVYQLDPWLPGRTIIVAPGDPSGVSSLLAQGRKWRLMMIGAFTLLIILGMGMTYRAVIREVEIARMRTDFVSNVSHELRTPLATIRISAEMLSMGMVPGEEKQQEYHDTILSESERLTRLIDNVLDFARIEQGRKKYRFRNGNIDDLLYALERVTSEFLTNAGFTLELDIQPELPMLPIDRDALLQALINLVTNAVQYTSDTANRENRRVVVSAAQDIDMLIVSVKDHGQGIDEKEQDKVFEKFQRGGDPFTRTTKGTGLGLAIVRHIAEAHGGKVRLQSEKGQGSTFSLVLPLERST